MSCVHHEYSIALCTTVLCRLCLLPGICTRAFVFARSINQYHLLWVMGCVPICNIHDQCCAELLKAFVLLANSRKPVVVVCTITRRWLLSYDFCLAVDLCFCVKNHSGWFKLLVSACMVLHVCMLSVKRYAVRRGSDHSLAQSQAGVRAVFLCQGYR